MRSIVVDNDLDATLFDRIADTLAKVFKVDTDNQRGDIFLRSPCNAFLRRPIMATQPMKEFYPLIMAA
ncbi:MAG TPA: hypothetical protein VMW90_02785 [Acidobacteriota bacterium]|nr:hypothetical protein [Acidobacteriota bacterium]